MNLDNRRTIRNYTQEPISDALLNTLLEKAFRASNTGNMQTYSVVVTRNAEKKQQLAPAHFGQKMVSDAPVVLTFCADYNRFTAWCKQRNAEPGYENLQSFVGAMIDATIVAQTFAVAAEEAGLGICYLGTTTYNADKIIDVLELPRLVVPVVTLTVGFPADMPDQTDRLPISGMIHNETYRPISTTEIDALYAEKEALPEMKQYTAENNKETLAQVFTDVRYTKANNEHFSNVFMNVLKSQGFMHE